MGPIQYIPRRGFPGYYFPFDNTPGYLSPLVAVFFEKPKRKISKKLFFKNNKENIKFWKIILGHVLINIECKAWAHNIIHDRYERRGSVHFELQVD